MAKWVFILALHGMAMDPQAKICASNENPGSSWHSSILPPMLRLSAHYQVAGIPRSFVGFYHSNRD